MNNQLPIEILKKAIDLRNSVRNIYIALYTSGKPSSSVEIAKMVGHTRAYVNMRLEQLVDQGYAKVETKGKKKYYVAV